jgi:hypothetical protein
MILQYHFRKCRRTTYTPPPHSYVLALLALLLPPPLTEPRLCLSSRRVTQIQNQLMTSTNAKAKKTLFLSPSPPHELAA